MHAKYYNPTLGRFLSVDPMGGEVGSSQGWNRYAYVSNNPMKYLDRSGNMKVRAWSTRLGNVYEIGFETRVFLAAEVGKKMLPKSMKRANKIFRFFDEALKGEFIETHSGFREKWGVARFEASVLSVFEDQLGGKGVGGWPRTPGGYGLYDRSQLGNLAKAVDMVINRMVSNHEITTEEAAELRKTYNIEKLLGKADEELTCNAGEGCGEPYVEQVTDATHDPVQ
jgi:hypothetical protein